jgi:hypothetical protein
VFYPLWDAGALYSCKASDVDDQKVATSQVAGWEIMDSSHKVGPSSSSAEARRGLSSPEVGINSSSSEIRRSSEGEKRKDGGRRIGHNEDNPVREEISTFL